MASISKRGDSYYIRVFLGFDSDGKRITESTTWKPETKLSPKKEYEAVQHFAADYEKELKSGKAAPGSCTLQKYVDTIWLSKIDAELKPNTVRRYKIFLRRILPALGYLKLENIQPQQIRAFLDDLAEDKREDLKYQPKKKAVELASTCNKCQLARKSGIAASTILNISRNNQVAEESAIKFAKAFDMKVERLFDRNEEPLSPTTILHYYRTLSTIMTSALHDDYIKDNPLRRVKAPRAGKHKNSYLDDVEALKLLDLVKEKAKHPFDLIVSTLIQTGMRRGECIALTWDDINFNERTICISKALLYLPERGVFEDTPKNESSVRIIKVGTTLIEELKEFKKWQEQEAINVRKRGGEWQDSGRVFTSGTGANMNPGTVTSWFHKFICDNDLPYVSIHGLRHTNASIMIARGVPITTAAKRLGHTTAATTAKIYAHEIASVDAKTAELIDDFISGNDQTNI